MIGNQNRMNDVLSKETFTSKKYRMDCGQQVSNLWGGGVLSFVVDCVVYYIDFLKLILHIFVECTAQRAFVSINLLV